MQCPRFLFNRALSFPAAGLLAIGVAACSARAGTTTQPAPSSPPPPISEQRQMQAQFGRLPALPVQSLADVLRFSVVGKMLTAQSLLKNPPPLVRLTLPNATLTTVQTLPPMHRGMGTSLGFIMSSRGFSASGSMSVITTVSCTVGRLDLSRDYESPQVLGSVQLIEDPPPMFGQQASNVDPVRLFVRRINQLNQQTEVKLNLSAANFVELVRAHPAEVQKYLRPLFHDLGQEATVFAPNPAAVWQALAEDWKPNDGTTNAVRAAIAKFDADDFRERESAAHALNQLGEPAALTLMRMDRGKFSAAITSGVDTFLAPYLPLSPEEAKRLGNDRDFLLDSQYLDDPALRRLAAARLAKITGQPAGFDPAADDDTRLAQISRLRAGEPTTSPE